MARDESRPTMECLAKQRPQLRRGGKLPTVHLQLDGKPLYVVGYSTGFHHPYATNEDTYLIVSTQRPDAPFKGFDAQTDAVHNLFLLDVSVRPWLWTLLEINDLQGIITATDLKAECTIV